MKLTFKDLKQQKFTLEAEPTDTISSIKDKIAEEKGWDKGLQKLIYSGKILQDESTIESYKIEEKGFIVCMVTKPKAQPAAAAPPATPAGNTSIAATPAAPQAAAAGSNTGSVPPASPSPAPASSVSATGGDSFNDPSALAMGEQRNAAIANMESMGFQRAEIDRAMRAAFYNPDRAVEYLLSGIPEAALREQAGGPGGAGAGAGAGPAGASSAPTSANPSAQSAPAGDEQTTGNLFDLAAQSGGRGGSAQRGAGAGATAQAGQGGLDAAIAAGVGTGDDGRPNFDFLRNNPIFQQLRQVVQQQPQMLEPILQQVAAGNPQLAQVISQHPEDFMQLLAEDVDDDAQLPAGAQQIAVSEEERDAIERLCRLGFERDLVIQAYFACDRNEELAANFLFDHPDDQEDQQ